MIPPMRLEFDVFSLTTTVVLLLTVHFYGAYCDRNDWDDVHAGQRPDTHTQEGETVLLPSIQAVYLVFTMSSRRTEYQRRDGNEAE
jgi:hypothetical protein